MGVASSLTPCRRWWLSAVTSLMCSGMYRCLRRSQRGASILWTMRSAAQRQGPTSADSTTMRFASATGAASAHVTTPTATGAVGKGTSR
jgi:hypothetical protein